MRRHTTLRTVLATSVAAAIALSSASCADPPGRGGSAEAAVTLRSVYGNGVGSVGADALRALLEDKESPVELDDITDDVVTETTNDSDGDTITALRSGGADIAVVRAGRLVTEGAASLAPLSAPMVVTNDEQARAIAADPAVLEALDGLEGIDLVGLALVPGGLRHPFGYGTPLAAPGDFTGALINTRPDAGAEAIMTALGARIDHTVGSERSEAAASGSLRGIETAMGQSGAVDLPAVVTSNLSLYEKYDVIVVRRKVFEGLSAAQQTALRTRAQADAAAAVTERATEEDGLTEWCAQSGGSSIVIPRESLDAFHAALDPLVTQIAQDAEAARVIDRIRALHDGTSDAAGTTCDGASPQAGDAFALQPTGDQGVLDGTWRTDASFDAIVEATGSSQKAADNAGIWTWRIQNGVVEIDQPSGAPCAGQLTISGQEVVLDLNSPPNNGCGGLARATFRVSEESISFTWTDDLDGEAALDQALFREFTRVKK